MLIKPIFDPYAVPYSGATGAVNLNGQWIQMTQAQLNIQNINAELQRRTNEPKPVPEE